MTAAVQLASPLTPIPAVDSRVLQLATALLGKLDELEDLIVQISVADGTTKGRVEGGRF